MLQINWELRGSYLEDHADRRCIKDELTKDMLRRSHDALTRSYELLAKPVPFVWHPEQQKEQ